MLVPGQEDSRVYALGGAGVGRQDGQVMVVHGNLNLAFFKDLDHEQRVRGIFVSGLAYPDKRDRLKMGTLQFQGGHKQKTLRRDCLDGTTSTSSSNTHEQFRVGICFYSTVDSGCQFKELVVQKAIASH
jgi:hypothetical protein